VPESLSDYTDDARLLESVQVLAPRGSASRGLRALSIAFAHAGALRRCSVLRVFQITGVVPALIARARFGVPYVTTYGFSYDALSRPGPTRPLKAFLERVGLRHAAAVIATTEALRTRAARRARRVELIPNGVDTDRFAPPAAERARPAGGPRRVLYVGRLSEEKNLSTLVRAAALLRDRLPLRLVLVGDGPLRQELAAEARAAGVATDFRGVVDQRVLPELYAAAHAFVLASFTEGHPKVLLEAMATGLPCVASDCEGNRSLVTPERTGLLFDPRSPGSLAACLERVLTDQGLAGTVGRAARELVTTQYDLGRRVQQEIALLRSVARSSAP
jgi:glycosyltransferase involved in cell wall biosynthesis